MKSRTGKSPHPRSAEPLATARSGLSLRLSIYAMFFLSGATALTLEILWSRQFVTVFGNSSYAISVVLCAFMAGLGLGSLLGGKLADRFRNRLLLYGIMQAGVALWAMGIPLLLEVLRSQLLGMSLLAPQSLLLPSLARFVVSFAVLLVPCMMMGATLPLLIRFCADSADVIGRRVGMLYGLNTIGAAAGCFTAGLWMIQTLGLSATNWLAVCINLSIAMLVLLHHVASARSRRAVPDSDPPAGEVRGERDEPAPERPPKRLLLVIAFFTGLAGLCCEVIWVRYLGFFSNVPYVFTYILGMYLVGLGVGSLLYRMLPTGRGRALSILAWVLLMLGWAVPSFFAASGLILSLGEPGTANVKFLMVVIVVTPSVLMGMTFPLVCSALAGGLDNAGRSVGAVYAVNTIGSIVGSLIPIFVLIPTLGMQQSILLMGLLYVGMGLVLLVATTRRRRGLSLAGAGLCAALMVAVFTAGVPGDLCKRSFRASSDRLGRHNDILFYQEGRTGTAIVVRDKVSGLKSIYINGIEEVPTTYADMVCFKLMGALGPLLHPNPDQVAMICFGGGVAAGSAVQHPDVKSLEVVDLESSVVEAAGLLTEENNDLLRNPKLRVTIDDGRNYILVSKKNWPVIISDSTHPKSSDSWVLYTREFYELINAHLTGDGVFVQWLPMHDLSVAEYKIILRTFQSVFPNASLWVSHGISETGGYTPYTLLVSTPKALSIDVKLLERKLSAPAVAADLRPWSLDDSVGVLENFVCGSETMRRWTGPGPVNTDDLPYTQYRTMYSGAPGELGSALAGVIESVWPYLDNTGDRRKSDALKSKLALHRKANRLMFLGRYADAFALLPDDERVRRWRENRKLSAEHISRVAGYYRDCPGILVRLGRQLLHMGHADRAAVELERAIAVKDEHAEAHFNLAMAQAQQGQADRAVASFQRAIAIKDDYAEAHFNLGAIRARQGRPDEAIEHFKRAIAIDPDDSEAHFNLGKVAAQKGGGDQAVDYFKKAIAIAPGYAEAHSHLGAVLSAQGNLDEAIDHFKRSVACEPDAAEVHFSLAAAQARRGRLVEAIAHYKRAVEIKPDYVEAYANLGAVRAQQGWLNEAVIDLKRAIAIKSDYAEAHNNLGAVVAQQGNLDQAITHYKRAVAIKDDYAEAHTNLGLSRAQQGKLDRAIAHYRKAISVGPRYTRARCRLGDLLTGQGKFDEAIAQFSEVLRIAPDHPEARRGLVRAQQLKSNTDRK